MIRFYCEDCKIYYRNDSEGLIECPICKGRNIKIQKLGIK